MSKQEKEKSYSSTRICRTELQEEIAEKRAQTKPHPKNKVRAATGEATRGAGRSQFERKKIPDFEGSHRRYEPVRVSRNPKSGIGRTQETRHWLTAPEVRLALAP